MTELIKIKNIKKRTKKIENLTNEKGSYQCEYWTDECSSLDMFSDWLKLKIIPLVQNDFNNYVLDQYQDTYIELITCLENNNLYDFFILYMTDFSDDLVKEEFLNALVTSMHKNKVFENGGKVDIGLQMWIYN